MKLFISYSRDDEAVAVLLATILESRGINCLYDRKLRPAEAFDEQLQGMIREADSILVLLTNSATSSAWVNQEIGFAVASGKPIWPIAMEENIKPTGLISTTQMYSLFDWSDTERTINRLVDTLQKSPAAPPTYKLFGLPQVLQGKLSRTKFVNRAFRQLSDSTDPPLTICNQAAFSIFCASDDPLYREAGKHTASYMKALLEERHRLIKLIERGACLNLILWPVRAYEQRYLGIRYRNLLEWMERTRNNERVQYVLSQYSGPNRYIVDGHWCIDGYKIHHSSGYEMSIVHYDDEHIKLARGEFDAFFKHAESNKAETIKKIEAMYRTAITPGAAEA